VPKGCKIRIIDCCQRSNNEKLKETLSNANSFEGKGLTVEQKNGKVYVSMENKLLFNSGSWAVGSEGKKQW
jgi:chemotaxis protein MotB